MIEINFARAVELVQAEIQESGEEFVYERYEGDCWNVVPDENGNPVGSCLVGKALIRAGITPLDFEKYEAEQTSADEISWVLGQGDIVVLTRKATSYFARLQTKQDCGFSWGEAHREAVELVERHDLDDLFS